MLVIRITLNDKIEVNPNGIFFISLALNRNINKISKNKLIPSCIHFDYEQGEFIIEFRFYTFLLNEKEKERLLNYLLEEMNILDFIKLNFEFLFSYEQKKSLKNVEIIIV